MSDAIGFLQIDERLLGIGRSLGGDFGFAHARHAQHVEHQHAVIGGDGAPALGDDGGVRHVDFVAHALHVIDDVVGVFLQGVVHARFEIRLRAVVIDAQAAAHIQIVQAGAGARQVHVHAHGFVHRALDLADVGDLAAQMEVEQVQAIGHACVLQLLQRAHGFGGREAELGAVAARGFPAPGAAAGQLHAQPDHGPHAHPRGVFQNQVQLGVFLDHRDDLAPDLLRQHRHLDVLVVLEAVADDGRFVIGHGHHGHQFGFGAGLQAELERTGRIPALPPPPGAAG